MAENMVWREIEIDVITNLPSDGHGYNHCLTVTDCYTRWIEMIPLRTKAAPEVAYNLYQLICRYGCPERILSDQGN